MYFAYFQKSAVTQFPAVFMGESMASDWPSSPRKDGWNYCIAAWPIRGLVVPHENWREMLYQLCVVKIDPPSCFRRTSTPQVWKGYNKDKNVSKLNTFDWFKLNYVLVLGYVISLG